MSNMISQQIHLVLKYFLYPKTLGIKKSSSIIKKELSSDKPSMIARFGAVEIKGVLYSIIPLILRKIFKRRVYGTMETNAGFFPVNKKSIKQFSNLMKNDMKLLDILGSWRIEECLLQTNFRQTKRIPLTELEPYLQKDPWSEVLEGKKVLVIHPFNKTIEAQYTNNRERLFKDKRVLPEFKSLETIKAVQTIAGNRAGFADWFEALEYMKAEIDKRDFDIAIIGCGAYGFPLAAHVKRIGKKAVHLGGPTQILFGVKGKRWIENEKFNSIINEYFVFPSDEDIPENAQKVEGGCYW